MPDLGKGKSRIVAYHQQQGFIRNLVKFIGDEGMAVGIFFRPDLQPVRNGLDSIGDGIGEFRAVHRSILEVLGKPDQAQQDLEPVPQVQFLGDPVADPQDPNGKGRDLLSPGFLFGPLQFRGVLVECPKEFPGQAVAYLLGQVGLHEVSRKYMHYFPVDACHDGKQLHQGIEHGFIHRSAVLFLFFLPRGF